LWKLPEQQRRNQHFEEGFADFCSTAGTAGIDACGDLKEVKEAGRGYRTCPVVVHNITLNVEAHC
jgi:hypothetical protein